MSKIPVHSQQAKNLTSSFSEEGGLGPDDLDRVAAEAAGDGAALRALGLTNPGTVPNEHTGIPDLLIYALVPYGGSRPDYGMVLGVAAELDALAMFMVGPLSITLEMQARRLRTAVDLSWRIRGQEPPEGAAGAEDA